MTVNILRLFVSRCEMNVELHNILGKLFELDGDLRYTPSNNCAYLKLGTVEYCVRFAVYATRRESHRAGGLLLTLLAYDWCDSEVYLYLQGRLRDSKFTLKHKAVAECLGGKYKKYFNEKDWI